MTAPRGFIFFALVTFTVGLMLKYASEMTSSNPLIRKPPWQQIAKDKRLADLAKIPPSWRLGDSILKDAKKRSSIVGDFIDELLDEDSRRITGLDVSDLISMMGNKSLTAVATVSAFSKRAAYVHQLTQNMLEIGFDLALRRAEELDEHFERTGNLVGPLHGIPLTLKDQFHIKGLGTSMAYVGWIDTFEGKTGTGKEKVFESQIIKDFYALGAIPLGKTSLVTSLWSPETNNNILGYQWNPHNQRLSSGGSSGGEAVMQAMRGSAFGIGTDIGGSVSMPASYNGVFSIKPSSGRMSMKGVANTAQGQQVMPTTLGIMAHSASTLRLVLESVLSKEQWREDPYVVPLPWRDPEERQPKADTSSAEITFGLMKADGIVTPHPPVSRALKIVEQALREAGHQLLDWQPPSNGISDKIHGPVARGDGCPDVWEALQLSGEPPVPQIARLFEGGGPKPPIPLPEYEDVVVLMKEYRTNYQEYWASSATRTLSGQPVSAVIQPVSPYAAVLPGKFYYSAR
ncbi:hypothetical protein INS49_006118 [Diaporthe citri]|uniref:uncharacterized protein n=1 Tax=Diaporthe citri TaxID=83186 RepID=UPI001C80BFB4|nr:uncharacterized protein INS49_006118 [Diaporthe citri]KAG6364517.1 hypothetical protein INS49_006118 [Diaporthe citri]